MFPSGMYDPPQILVSMVSRRGIAVTMKWVKEHPQIEAERGIFDLGAFEALIDV
jgi:hypothetical protein